MSPGSKLSGTWPDRPKGFYKDWNTFCVTALSELVREQEDLFAVALLAGGAVLGASGMVALAKANQEFFDRKGQELGIPNLGAIAVGGGAALGAAMGSVGGYLINKTLGRGVDKERLAATQARLTAARREFDLLQQDRRNDLLTDQHLRLAVERLYNEVLEQERGG